MSTVCVSDVDLVARARQGDPAAFGELVERHRMAVYRAALAALGSHADAEDAAQDAFLVAFRRLGQLSRRGELQDLAADHRMAPGDQSPAQSEPRLAADGRAEGSEEMESVLENVAAAGPTPEAEPRQHELRGQFERAIRSLSPKLRDALLLAQSGEYSYDEIGDDAAGADRDDQVARVRSAARRAGEIAAAGLRCPMNGWTA